MKEEETYEFYREQTLLLTEEYKKLKERIDKAIENINKYEEIHGINYMFENEDFKEELLNILKGSDKDV